MLFIDEIISSQKEFFKTGKTLDIKYRREKLINFKKTIKKYENELIKGLYLDLGKSKVESYMCEIGLVYEEINYMVKHIKKLSKPKKVHTPIAQTLAKSFQVPSPYGQVLIMSPWNYPFLLAFDPLVDAFASGNTVILKVSRFAENTNLVMQKIIEEAFDKSEVSIVFGGHDVNQYLLESDIDYIFFTGSKNVGKVVYKAACEKMIPVTLELGGKSPCIVDETAKIKLAAKRIVFGKLLNCGQTCVAPDYIYCHESIKDELIKEIIKQIHLQYGEDPINNKDYGKIISKRHFEKAISFINQDKVIFGGKIDSDRLKIEPTIMDNVTSDDLVMKEEIFAPIFPIITFKEIDEVISYVNTHEAPLAFYYFSTNKKRINKLLNMVRFGGGCINDTIIHLATCNMGFGGFGASGIGSYHGKAGFDTFTHYKSIVDKKNIIDLPMRYQPYKKTNEKLIRMFLK